MDAISETRLALVIPILSTRVHSLEDSLGFEIRVTRGLATVEEQTCEWSQGRAPLVTVNAQRKNLGWAPLTQEQNVIVTHAPPYHSWHEYACAVDVVPMTPLPDWDNTHPTWQKIINTAPQFGLVDGIHWHDSPHLQLKEIPVSPTPIFINALQNSGIKAAQALIVFGAA